MEFNYEAGTPIRKMFDRLKTGKTFTKDALYKDIDNPRPFALYAWIKIHGVKSKAWSVVETDKGVTMKLKAKAVKKAKTIKPAEAVAAV